MSGGLPAVAPCSGGTVAPSAYAKILMHAFKRPSNAVCGLLIGTIATAPNGPSDSSDNPTTTNVNEKRMIVDAVPLFHTHQLQPPLNVALALTEQWLSSSSSKSSSSQEAESSSTKRSIAGVYFANDDSFAEPLEQARALHDAILKKVPDALLFMIDTKLLKEQSVVVAYGPRKGDARARQPASLWQLSGRADPPKIHQELFDSASYGGLVDFDDHLHDPRLDFFNTHLQAELQAL
eukprot:GHVU01202980.1.p1 GENE.GHVU01202980.1~~GHVU01202980.1.p1  ORF type:complete len:236 (-),score=44.57 GHVU01202980.1:907-1614(-)